MVLLPSDGTSRSLNHAAAAAAVDTVTSECQTGSYIYSWSLDYNFIKLVSDLVK